MVVVWKIGVEDRKQGDFHDVTQTELWKKVAHLMFNIINNIIISNIEDGQVCGNLCGFVGVIVVILWGRYSVDLIL